ncbi:pirin family protein [Saccharicrinis fermentans]
MTTINNIYTQLLALTHSMGNESLIKAGDIQVMSAGSSIFHCRI